MRARTGTIRSNCSTLLVNVGLRSGPRKIDQRPFNVFLTPHNSARPYQLRVSYRQLSYRQRRSGKRTGLSRAGWVVNELVRWETDTGSVVVEMDRSQPGFQSVTRKPGEIIVDVKKNFEDALKNVRDAAVSALDVFRDEVLNPDQVEIEFGVKLSVAAGAVIASTAAEGHLTVKLSWSRETAPTPAENTPTPTGTVPQ